MPPPPLPLPLPPTSTLSEPTVSTSNSNDSLGEDLFSAAGTPTTPSSAVGTNNVYSNAVVDFQKANADVYETLRGQLSRILVIYTGGTIGMKSLNPDKVSSLRWWWFMCGGGGTGN